MSDESGTARPTGAPTLAGLLGALRPRRPGETSELGGPMRGRRDRMPSQDQLDELLQDGSLVLPPRYIVGYYLDLLI